MIYRAIVKKLSILLTLILISSTCYASAQPVSNMILNLVSSPEKYQIHLYDLLSSDTYCDIEDVDIDTDRYEITIRFDYRGGTTLKLTHYDRSNSEIHGHYPISLPFLGTSNVQVSMNCKNDGTAYGRWANMGYSGAFDIVRKY